MKTTLNNMFFIVLGVLLKNFYCGFYSLFLLSSSIAYVKVCVQSESGIKIRQLK